MYMIGHSNDNDIIIAVLCLLLIMLIESRLYFAPLLYSSHDTTRKISKIIIFPIRCVTACRMQRDYYKVRHIWKEKKILSKQMSDAGKIANLSPSIWNKLQCFR